LVVIHRPALGVVKASQKAHAIKTNEGWKNRFWEQALQL
jgi:hypothetical protein